MKPTDVTEFLNLENMIAIELSNNGCPIYCGNFSA